MEAAEEVSNNSQKKSKDKWSSLPVLLIWMIKDKLDFFDDGILARVCRDWHSASLLYPNKHQSVRDGMPWLMDRTTVGTTLEFINFAMGKSYTFDVPEFVYSKVLFSNQGWFLLETTNHSPYGNIMMPNRLPDCLILINPFTRSKIKVPDLEVEWRTCPDYCGSFSTRESNPHCIVLGKSDKHHQVTFATAYAGDLVWTEHSYDRLRERNLMLMGIGIMGQFIYCVDLKGTTIIYNTSTQVLKEELAAYGTIPCLLECEKRIVKVERDRDHHRFEFFWYKDKDCVWERLGDDDLKDRSWFLLHGRNGFSTRREGCSRVYCLPYTFPHIAKTEEEERLADRATIYDLVKGRIERSPYNIWFPSTWVDIG